MKRVLLSLAAAALLTLQPAIVASAQSTPPPLPTLTADQESQVQQQLGRYRTDTEARVARGEINPDEAERLIAWREWQLAQQAAGLAPSPPAPPAVATAPYPAPYYAAPYYGPYYGPYYAPYYGYYGPYWGLSFCAARGYRHGFGSICI